MVVRHFSPHLLLLPNRYRLPSKGISTPYQILNAAASFTVPRRRDLLLTYSHPSTLLPRLTQAPSSVLHRTKLHSFLPSVTFASLVLPRQLKTRFPTARGSSGHRLFIYAVMISKATCDPFEPIVERKAGHVSITGGESEG
jgi:hypothetical protein